MRKLIVLTLAFMLFGVYDYRRPHKVAAKADSEEVSHKCGQIKTELEEIKAELERLEKLVIPPAG
jgi:hypothetical protein